MMDPSIKFLAVDLNRPISWANEKYDLAISLEVAEHIEESSATTFIASLTALADVVMFGAAYTMQGGVNHINEQPHTYWARIFKDFGYLPYDFFRPVFWGNDEIEFWYRQNTFIYVKQGAEFASDLAVAGCSPIPNIEFMNCIHPKLYELKLNRKKKRTLLGYLSRKT